MWIDAARIDFIAGGGVLALFPRRAPRLACYASCLLEPDGFRIELTAAKWPPAGSVGVR